MIWARVSNPLTRWLCRNNLEIQSTHYPTMQKALALVVVLMMPMSGCLMTPGDVADDIFFDTDQFWLTYGLDNWEMANEYVKNPDNETTSTTVHELNIDFSDTQSYNPDVWVDHFWLAPNDGSPAQVVDANASQHLLYTPQGYGAFNLRFGMVLNTGSVYWHGYPLSNNSLEDHAPFIRSAWFEFEETRETAFAELYVDGPHEASLGWLCHFARSLFYWAVPVPNRNGTGHKCGASSHRSNNTTGGVARRRRGCGMSLAATEIMHTRSQVANPN